MLQTYNYYTTNTLFSVLYVDTFTHRSARPHENGSVKLIDEEKIIIPQFWAP